MPPVEEEVQPEKVQPDPDDDRFKVLCWACGLLIKLPPGSVPEGCIAADIQWVCGGCGAENAPYSVGEPGGCIGKPRKSSQSTWLGCSVRCRRKWLGKVLLVIVPSLISYIGAASFYLLLGVAAPAALEPITVLHIVLAMAFLFQIAFNYIETVMASPGCPTKGVEFGTLAAAADGRLKGFSLCRRCETPRPKGAHHCSTCNTCHLELDHHCVFVDNCVGFANRRNFVLFCLYAVMGCTYPLIMIALATHWDASAVVRILFPQCMPEQLQKLFSRMVGSRPYSAEGGGFSLLAAGGCAAAAPPRYPWMPPEPKLPDGFLMVGGLECLHELDFFLLMGLFLGCASVIGGVGILLLMQVHALSYGTTTLVVRQARPLVAPTFCGRCRLAVSNIFKTVGPPHTWICPRRGALHEDQGGWPEPPRLAPLASSADDDANGHTS